MIDVDTFTEEQKQFLSRIVDDLNGQTATGSLLYFIERLVFALKPDWEISTFASEDDIKDDFDVCLAALNYLKVKDAAQK